MKRYEVGMQAYIHFTVTVEAKNKKEALKKAEDDAEWLEHDIIEYTDRKIDGIVDSWEA
jgi:hypothetical protein